MPRFFKFAYASWDRFNDGYGDSLAAAISFYSLLSIAPMTVVALTVAGILFDRLEARDLLLDNVRRFTNEDMAQLLLRQLQATTHGGGKIAALIATAALIYSASRLFVQLQTALNVMWGVRVRDANTARETIQRFLTKQLISFAMVMGSGALLLFELVLQTVLADVSGLLTDAGRYPLLTGAFGLAQQTIVPLALLSVVFAIIFRVLPDARIEWRDVWIGSLLTASLVLLGTWLLGLYLARIAPGWLQGAVGSIAVFMIWTYYLAQVFLLGAAFTRVWAGRKGDSIRPAAHAELEPDSGAAQRSAQSARQSSVQ